MKICTPLPPTVIYQRQKLLFDLCSLRGNMFQDNDIEL